MSFSNAFKYPFNNFAKVFSIVLVLTIAFAVFIGLMLNSHDWSPLLAHLYDLDPAMYEVGDMQPMGGTAVVGLLGALVVAIVSGFWLSGYSIDVIRAVMNDIELMPEIELSRNLKDGFYLFLSSIAYWVLFLVLVGIVAIIASFVGLTDGFGRFIAIVSVPFVVAASCLMGWAYFIGMARFAVEGDYRASWQIKRNLELSKQNWGSGASLLVYMIFLSMVYNIMRGIVDGILGGMGGLMLGITISIVIYYFFNLMQHFSTQHLIAQFATQIGLNNDRFNPEKSKVDYA